MSRRRPTESDEFLEQGLPSAPEIERNVLGAVLLENSLIDALRSQIHRDIFFLESNKRIFDAMCQLRDAGQPIELALVSEALRIQGYFEQVGGATYIASLIDGVPRTDTIDPYVAPLYDAYALRRIIGKSYTAIADAFDRKPFDLITADLEKELSELIGKRKRKQPTQIGIVADRVVEDAQERATKGTVIIGLPTGLTDLDHKTLGLRPPKFYVIAGRPSMGKTALAGQIAISVGKQGRHVLFLSLEMSEDELVLRFLSGETRIDSQRILTGQMNKDEWTRISEAVLMLNDLPVYIHDEDAITVPQMQSLCRQFVIDHGELNLVITDYLQRFRALTNSPNPTHQLNEISKGHVNLAKEFYMPVIGLSQLSRKPEERANHRPVMSDLRDSGGIEQDADFVGLIYREEFYKPTEENRGIAELNVAKHRGGPRGPIHLCFLDTITRFENLAREARTSHIGSTDAFE